MPRKQKPSPALIPDAVRTQPTTVVAASEVEAKLAGWLVAMRPTPNAHPNAASEIMRKKYRDVGELVRDIHQTCEEWINELDDAEL